METGSLIVKETYDGADFRRLIESDGWSVAFLRRSERFATFGMLERHLETEEVFVLLSGSATLYATETEDAEPVSEKMKPLTVYCIPRGVWHHITVSEDASVLVVENRNTSKENTEKRCLSC